MAARQRSRICASGSATGSLTAAAWALPTGALWPWVLLGALVVVARVRRWAIVVVFIAVAGAVSVLNSVMNGQEPGAALSLVLTAYPFVFAGAFNGLLLPFGIGVLLWVATRRTDLLRGYAYPKGLVGIGWVAWLLTVYLAVRSVRPVIELFA